MTEDDLRALVREVVARHLAGAAPGAGGVPPPHPALGPLPPPALHRAASRDWRQHPSHVRLSLVTGLEQDGPCLVEPGVPCSHCGFCQSWGH
jgi:hypothetical protein